MKTVPDQSLKGELEAALAKAFSASGVEKFSRSDLIKRFLNKGVSQATLYRWIESSIASGKPGQAAVRAVKKAAEKRIGKPARKSRARPLSLEEMKDRLPAVVRLDEVSSTPTVKLIEELGIIVADLKALVAYAKTPDGKPRNARLLLMASDRIRACLETAMRIYQAMRDMDEVDRLHGAILEEIGREAPAVKERILRRLAAMATGYGA